MNTAWNFALHTGLLPLVCCLALCWFAALLSLRFFCCLFGHVDWYALLLRREIYLLCCLLALSQFGVGLGCMSLLSSTPRSLYPFKHYSKNVASKRQRRTMLSNSFGLFFRKLTLGLITSTQVSTLSSGHEVGTQVRRSIVRGMVARFNANWIPAHTLFELLREALENCSVPPLLLLSEA